MKISVVIVSWNAKAYLLECLESVVRQLPPDDLEVIVVDNASSDGSPEAVRDSYPSVKLICNDGNDGFAKGNNVGIRASTGDYLFLINSDVVVSDGCFRKMVGTLDQHPEVGMLGPGFWAWTARYSEPIWATPRCGIRCAARSPCDSLFPRSEPSAVTS